MKTLSLFSVLFVLQFTAAHAFTGNDQFKVELVKPYGEYGFRAFGKGNHLSEMRFDCSEVSEMGLKITMVNTYGKTSRMVLPAGKLGDKVKCQEQLKAYFAGLYTKRSLASLKKEKPRTVELNNISGSKKLSFL